MFYYMILIRGPAKGTIVFKNYSLNATLKEQFKLSNVTDALPPEGDWIEEYALKILGLTSPELFTLPPAALPKLYPMHFVSDTTIHGVATVWLSCLKTPHPWSSYVPSDSKELFLWNVRTATGHTQA